MSESFEFEVRPLHGATAAVGEEVSFREEGGKLYALNEDGEAFGVVPKAVAARLEAAGVDSLSAEVASRADGIPTVSVEVAEAPAGDAAVQSAVAAGAETVAKEESDDAPGPEQAAARTGTAPADASGTKKSKIKYVVIAAVAAAVIVIVACVSLFSGGATQTATQTVTSDWFSVEVPEDWTVETLNEDAEAGSGLYCVHHIYSDEPGFYLYIGGPRLIDSEYALAEEFDDSSHWRYGSEFTMDGAVVHQYQVDSAEVYLTFAPDDYELADDSTEWAGYVYYIYSGSEYMVVEAYCLADEYDESVGELEAIWDSVVLEDASEPESAVPELLD